MRQTGVVKSFDDAKGYGWIAPDDGSPPCFVHYTGIRAKGFRSLSSGQRVEYEPVNRGKGPAALDVMVIAQPNVSAA